MNPKTFFGKLKRCNVYKAAVAYAVVGWLLIVSEYRDDLRFTALCQKLNVQLRATAAK